MTQTMVRDRALLRWPYMRASMPTAMSRKPTDWVGNIILLNSSTGAAPRALCSFHTAFKRPARNTRAAPKGSNMPEHRFSLFFRSRYRITQAAPKSSTGTKSINAMGTVILVPPYRLRSLVPVHIHGVELLGEGEEQGDRVGVLLVLGV